MQLNHDEIKTFKATDREQIGDDPSDAAASTRVHEPTLRDLFPTSSAQELNEAEGNLVEYLKVVLRISDRLRQERGFDGHRPNHYDDDERSNLAN